MIISYLIVLTSSYVLTLISGSTLQQAAMVNHARDLLTKCGIDLQQNDTLKELCAGVINGNLVKGKETTKKINACKKEYQISEFESCGSINIYVVKASATTTLNRFCFDRVLRNADAPPVCAEIFALGKKSKTDDIVARLADSDKCDDFIVSVNYTQCLHIIEGINYRLQITADAEKCRTVMYADQNVESIKNDCGDIIEARMNRDWKTFESLNSKQDTCKTTYTDKFAECASFWPANKLDFY